MPCEEFVRTNYYIVRTNYRYRPDNTKKKKKHLHMAFTGRRETRVSILISLRYEGETIATAGRFYKTKLKAE